MNVQRMRLWVKSTSRHKKHKNTYVAKELPPHHVRMRAGYKHIASYRNGDYVLGVAEMPRSNPRCYFVQLGHPKSLALPDIFCAYIEAKSIIPFLVRFNWRMSWSIVRQSFDLCIPQRNEPDLHNTFPVWFTRITAGYQTIWFTTGKESEVYFEVIRWYDDLPVLEDYKFMDHIGRDVREIVW